MSYDPTPLESWGALIHQREVELLSLDRAHRCFNRRTLVNLEPMCLKRFGVPELSLRYLHRKSALCASYTAFCPRLYSVAILVASLISQVRSPRATRDFQTVDRDPELSGPFPEQLCLLSPQAENRVKARSRTGNLARHFSARCSHTVRGLSMRAPATIRRAPGTIGRNKPRMPTSVRIHPRAIRATRSSCLCALATVASIYGLRILSLNCRRMSV